VDIYVEAASYSFHVFDAAGARIASAHTSLRRSAPAVSVAVGPSGAPPHRGTGTEPSRELRVRVPPHASAEADELARLIVEAVRSAGASARARGVFPLESPVSTALEVSVPVSTPGRTLGQAAHGSVGVGVLASRPLRSRRFAFWFLFFSF
jgi:hypothetical protein